MIEAIIADVDFKIKHPVYIIVNGSKNLKNRHFSKIFLFFAFFSPKPLDNQPASCYNSRPQTMRPRVEGLKREFVSRSREWQNEFFDNQVRDK